jgi:hypothetical protein
MLDLRTPSSPYSTSSWMTSASLTPPNSDAPDRQLPSPRERTHRPGHLRSVVEVLQPEGLLPLWRGPSPSSIPYSPRERSQFNPLVRFYAEDIEEIAVKLGEMLEGEAHPYPRHSIVRLCPF